LGEKESRGVKTKIRERKNKPKEGDLERKSERKINVGNGDPSTLPKRTGAPKEKEEKGRQSEREGSAGGRRGTWHWGGRKDQTKRGEKALQTEGMEHY